MKYTLVTDPEWVGPWVHSRIDVPSWSPTPATALGLADESDSLVAGLLFEGYVPARNIFVHLAIEEKAATLPLFRAGMLYVFGQLALPRLTLVASSSNIPAVELHRRLGAIQEGCLVGAARDGNDILISRLTPDCKLWRRFNGKEQQSSPES